MVNLKKNKKNKILMKRINKNKNMNTIKDNNNDGNGNIKNNSNCEKNSLLNALSENSKSIKNVIDNINDSNFPTSENLYNELLKFDIHKLLSIKANLEKADRVNFLEDEMTFSIKKMEFWINKETVPSISFFLGALSPFLISYINKDHAPLNIEVNQLDPKYVFLLQYSPFILISIFYLILIIILGFLKKIERNFKFRETNNKYKVFQYLVDIAIENKKKNLN